MNDNGFVRMRRSQAAEELNQDPNALALLVLIARRARWNDGPNRHNLKIGEAMVGDYRQCGLTRKKYRLALDRLEHTWKQITTARTKRGTIATLTEFSIFDVTQDQSAKKGPSKGPPVFRGENEEKGPSKGPDRGHQRAIRGPLTNNDIRKQRNNDDSKACSNSIPQAVAKVLTASSVFEGSYQNHPKFPEFAQWCKTRGGTPMAKGFDTWLMKQKPHWRNKPQPVRQKGESGWMNNGHFLTDSEANAQARMHPEIITSLKRAVRHANGTIKTL